MHYMPDTEDADSAAEIFWPEGFKQVIRQDVRQLIGTQLEDRKTFRHIYGQRHCEKFTDVHQFVSRIADMIAIGAENGADDAFDDIISAFLTESPLPGVRRYDHYFWPQALPQRLRKKLHQVVVGEYSQDEVYRHAHKVGYQGCYRNFGEFISQVAELAVTGAMNGADDMLEAIYRCFVTHHPLPPARRHPKRLKVW